jgi:preprotein translocase subunit SecA
MQMVESSVARDMITRLTHIQNEIGALVEEMETLSDECLMKDIEESRKDFKEGKYHVLKTDEDIDEFFKDLL